MKTKERPFGVTSGGEKLAYALGDLGSNFVWTFISSFLTLYYTDSVLMSAGLIGTIMLICRIFDGVSDILMGMLLEKTRTKMGKARPWFGGSIIPLVDIYNGISLTYGVPIGGEDIDKFDGDVHLTLANGSEEFVTYGSDKSEPPYPGEVVYKDNAGAICRCWNWRESVRTMLTEETTNALMIIETVGGEEADAVLEEALDALAQEIQKELGGTVRRHVASAEDPQVEILA